MGQRRKLDEETYQIAEMNKVFNFEKYRKKEESRGLAELRSLHQMLDEKNADYMGLERSTGSSKKSSTLFSSGAKVRRSFNHDRLNRDEWKKLD